MRKLTVIKTVTWEFLSHLTPYRWNAIWRDRIVASITLHVCEDGHTFAGEAGDYGCQAVFLVQAKELIEKKLAEGVML